MRSKIALKSAAVSFIVSLATISGPAMASLPDDVNAGSFTPSKVDCSTKIPAGDDGKTFKGSVEGTLLLKGESQDVKIFITSLGDDQSPTWQLLCEKSKQRLNQASKVTAEVMEIDFGQGQIQQFLGLQDIGPL